MELGNILLIDDDGPTNYVNQIIIKRSIKSDGVMVANNGLEGLDLVQSEDTKKLKEPKKNLILLDINMPKMDGWEFLEAYNQLSDQDKERNEIYMLSTSINPMDEFRAKESTSLKGFIRKPLTEDVVKRIAAA